MSEFEPTEPLREINREIASAVIFSKDGKILMGRKGPDEGGVYPDAWHIPGGGVEGNETLPEAMKREVFDETGIDVDEAIQIIQVPEIRYGQSEKTLKDSGEKVIAKMTFNLFEVYLDQNADDISLNPQEDLGGLKWFTPREVMDIQQIPGGKEFFIEKGYIPQE